MKRLQNERQLNATREKLQMLQEHYEEARQRTGDDQHVRELTLRTLGRLIKQLKEEIIWYECHARVREPSWRRRGDDFEHRRTVCTVYELSRTESVTSEAAVLVGVLLPDRKSHGEPLEELEGLAATAGVRVVGQLTQRREAPDAATYLGHGKVEELNAACRRGGRRPGDLRQRSEPRPDAQPGKGDRAEGFGPDGVDPRHFRHPRRRGRPGWRSSWPSSNMPCRG